MKSKPKETVTLYMTALEVADMIKKLMDQYVVPEVNAKADYLKGEVDRLHREVGELQREVKDLRKIREIRETQTFI